MAVIDQYKQIQDNLTVQKQARDMGYTVDKANKTIGVDPLKPITEEQRTQLTAKGWKVIDQQPTPTTTPEPQPVVPTTPTTPTAPAPVEKQVESTQIKTQTTPTATVEKDILSPNVTGMGTLTPEQQKLQTNAINKLNSNLSIYSTGKSLYDAVQGGSILPGTKEFTDLTTRNPRVLEEYNLIKAEKEKTDTIKTLGQAIVGETITPKPSNALEQLVSFFTKSMDTDVASEYQNTVINNPAYQNSIQALNGINQQIADNNNNITRLREDVRKKYSAGTPESLIASAIAREARPLIEQGQYLTQLQQNAQAEMTRIFEENKDVFDMKQEERKNQQNIAMQLYGTIRAEEIRAEDIQRADQELQMKMEQARTEQEYNMYKDQRDYNLKVAQAISEDEARNRTKASDFLKFEVPNEDGSVSTVYRNPITGQEMSSSAVYGKTPSTSQGKDAPIGQLTQFFSPEGQALLSVPDGTIVPTRLGQVSPQNASVRGKECAEYVNDIYGTKLGNTYESKLAVCNEKTGGIGSVAAWKPQGSGNFGHVGVIVDEDAENYYIKSSNYTPGTITTVPVPKENIQNFYTPPEIKQQQEKISQGPQPIKYANGNVRTPDGTLYTKKEVTDLNRQIVGSDTFKAVEKAPNMVNSLDKLEQLVNKYGSEVGLDRVKGLFGSTAATELKNAYTDILLQVKELYNLGVINGPDLGLVTTLIPSPVSYDFSTAGSTIKVEGTPFNSKTLAGIRSMRERISQQIQNQYQSLNRTYEGFGDTLPALKNIRTIQDQIDILNSYGE